MSSLSTALRNAINVAVTTLLDRFAPIADPVDVLLVGKDGGLEARAGQLGFEALFDRVDAMPMRRREIRQQAADGT